MHSLRASYDARPSSVPQARRAVERALVDWGHGELAWTGALLTSELVSNALLHARTPFTVAVAELPGGGARLEVGDGSRRLPRSRNYGDEATTGRGLHLLGELAEQWGSEVTESGKTVWAVLAPGLPDGAAVDGDVDLDALLLAFPDAGDGPAAGETPDRPGDGHARSA